MDKYYLAVDIGASSGRHMLGHMEDGKMVLEEVYRFENGMEEDGDSRCWNIKTLFSHILEGMKRCKTLGKIPQSMGVDTWGVDYVLLDSQDRILGKSYGYRDKRTDGMDEEVYKIVPEKELYERTGIQKQMFNTIYQLMSVKKKNPEHLKLAKTFLMLPDYFHYLLTGVKISEYTDATSTQLVNASERKWDESILKRLKYPADIFLPLSMPGTVAGNLKEEVRRQAGFDCRVILPAAHDTASAVMAVPAGEENCLYISSGTWSLMGVESKSPICTEESRRANFTNEGGYDCRYRYLKNIMGLWMIQSVRREWKKEYSFAEICRMAEECTEFPSRVDVNDDRFLAPDNMQEAVRSYLRDTGQEEPRSKGEMAAVIYQSLAKCYADTACQIEKITGRVYPAIHIVGGGANADYLNQLTARMSGKKVLAGPSEATAIGNLAAQMIAEEEFPDLKAARACIKRSFEVREYEAGQ